MKIRLPALPWLTLACAGAAWLIHRAPTLAPFLEFDRTAVARGEVWRIATAHFVHFNASHLHWDLAGLLLLGGWAETASRRRWALALGAATIVIPPLVAWLEPNLATYRGLSGLACVPLGLLVVALHRTARRHGDALLRATAWAAALGFLAKTGYEVVAGRTLFVDAGVDFVPVPLAHLAGFVIGVAAAWPAADAVTPPARSPGRRDAGCNTPGRPRETPPVSRSRWRRAHAGACPGR